MMKKNRESTMSYQRMLPSSLSASFLLELFPLLSLLGGPFFFQRYPLSQIACHPQAHFFFFLPSKLAKNILTAYTPLLSILRLALCFLSPTFLHPFTCSFSSQARSSSLASFYWLHYFFLPP